MAQRSRYPRYRNRQVEAAAESSAERQANVLTYQILLVVLLLAVAWGAKSLQLPVYEDIRRLSGLLSCEDAGVVSSAMGIGTLEDVLEDKFPGLPGLLNRFGILQAWFPQEANTPFPAETIASSDASGIPPSESSFPAGSSQNATASTSSGTGGQEPVPSSMEGKGGVSPASHVLDSALQRPRSVSFSPLFLSAQPAPPVNGRVTSFFGWRDNPLDPGNADFHTGLDIAAAEGSPIYASLPGVVLDTGYSDSYGNYIHIAHAGGLQTRYAHCCAIIARIGENIRQGERIALVGSTGNVTGPHLHFELRQDSVAYDPLCQLLA